MKRILRITKRLLAYVLLLDVVAVTAFAFSVAHSYRFGEQLALAVGLVALLIGFIDVFVLLGCLVVVTIRDIRNMIKAGR